MSNKLSTAVKLNFDNERDIVPAPKYHKPIQSLPLFMQALLLKFL